MNKFAQLTLLAVVGTAAVVLGVNRFSGSDVLNIGPLVRLVQKPVRPRPQITPIQTHSVPPRASSPTTLSELVKTKKMSAVSTETIGPQVLQTFRAQSWTDVKGADSLVARFWGELSPDSAQDLRLSLEQGLARNSAQLQDAVDEIRDGMELEIDFALSAETGFVYVQRLGVRSEVLRAAGFPVDLWMERLIR